MEDGNKTNEAKLASVERGLASTQNQLSDFQTETRENITAIFNKIDSLVENISSTKTTDWQQIAVLLTAFSMLGAFVLFGFINPMQKAIEKGEEERDLIVSEILNEMEKRHKIEVEQAIDKTNLDWIEHGNSRKNQKTR